jgi:uncharacterized protein DUF3455
MLVRRRVLPNQCASLLATISLLLTAAGCAATVESTEGVANASEALSNCAPQVPKELAVPAGNKLAFSADADGVQIYICQAGADGTPAWTLKAPDAKLFGKHGKLIGHHFAGPTWEAKDGSSVVGTKLAAYTADPSAIPWLLLQATSHSGEGMMTDVTYIQRLETTEGLAPQSGCDSDHLGTTVNSDYTATYYFYAAAHGGKHH